MSMSNHQIKIDRISIRSQGVAAPIAQSAVQGLGQELLTGLAQQRDSLGARQRIQIDNLNLGTLQVSNPQDTNQLRQAIAASVLRAITANLKTSDRR